MSLAIIADPRTLNREVYYRRSGGPEVLYLMFPHSQGRVVLTAHALAILDSVSDPIWPPLAKKRFVVACNGGLAPHTVI